MATAAEKINPDQLLVNVIQGDRTKGETGFTYDPLSFVMYVYPWGVEGTVLEKHDGPDTWQKEVLEHIRTSYEAGQSAAEAAAGAIRIAVSSGHGIGKTSLVAWIVHWFMSVFRNPQVVVTANTKTQLATKTWREVAKWHAMSIHEHWFDWAATTLKMRESPATWVANAIPWSEHNSEAFAGTHDENVLVIFDEASAIADIIWQVTEGAMTTANCMWVAFGNPTKNTGAFAQCFKRFRHRWWHKRVDSRTAKMADQKLIAEWIEDYGLDSDFVRVRVLGKFPRAGDMQLIPVDVVEAAITRECAVPKGTPRIMGVDVARYGSDMSVIARRHGRKLEPLSKYRGLDTMELAAVVAHAIREERPDMVMVDGTGIGAGVIDRLRQLGHDVLEVHFGGKVDPGSETVLFNKRIEMWHRMGVWLKTADIPRDPELYDDLISPEYYFDVKMRMRLESKDEMRKRGLASPDCFVAGTKVTTPYGYSNIEDIQVGDTVVTPYGNRKVIATQIDHVKSVSKFKFKNNAALSGKGKHRVFTWDCGFVRLDALSLTNEIESDSYLRLMRWQILNLFYTTARNTGFKHQVDIISQGTRLRQRDFFIEKFTSITTAKYQMAMMFITSISMMRITTQSTLRRFRKNCTSSYTWLKDSGIRCTLTKIVNTLNLSEGWRPNGTNQKKGESGTLSMGKGHGSTVILSTRFARYANAVIKHINQNQVGFAQKVAARRNHISDIKQQAGIASFAGMRSLTINTVSNHSAQDHAVISTGQKIPVFNLTLDRDNVYYANGILVENCADAVCLTFAYVAPPRLDYDQSELEPDWNEDM